MTPIRCLSSQLTTQILLYRNPHGAEATWLFQKEKINNYMLHIGKVLLAEIGLAVTGVTATVECVFYATASILLLFPSISMLPFRKTQAAKLCHSALSLMGSLCGSAWFTLIWNLENLLLFNLISQNVYTHESFARWAVNETKEGEFFAHTVLLLTVIIDVICLIQLLLGKYPKVVMPFYPDFYECLCARDSDMDYIVSQVEPKLNAFCRKPQIEQQCSPLMTDGFSPMLHVKEGSDFFYEKVLTAADFKESTRKDLLKEELSSEIKLFAAARCIYSFIYKTKKPGILPSPSFFKTKTAEHIRGIFERHYTLLQTAFLAPLMEDHERFEKERKERTIKDPLQRLIFDQLLTAAKEEANNSFLLSVCAYQASRKYLEKKKSTSAA